MEENQYFYDSNDENKLSVNTIKADRFNPFANPEEFIEYNEDYRVIVPQISMDNCSIPDDPDEREKRSIKKYYNKVGLMLLFHIVGSNLIAVMLSMVIGVFIGISGGSFSLLGSGTSINTCLTGISYLITNILVFFIGCKITGIDRSSLFRTRELEGSDMAIYIAAGLFLHSFSIMFSSMFVVPIFDNIFDTDTYAKLSALDSMSTVTQLMATCLYTCIIAPITEELVLRGFVLKNLSRTNQRFGIIASAFIFGLIHDNVPQFILAFTVGILLGYITIKHNSILPAIGIHIIINTSGVVLSFISKLSESTGEVVSIAWELITLILGVIVFIAAVAKKRIRLPKPTNAQKKRGLALFAASPCIIIAAVIHIGISVWYFCIL